MERRLKAGDERKAVFLAGEAGAVNPGKGAGGQCRVTCGLR